MDDTELSALVARLRRQGTDDATTEVKTSESRLSADVWESVSAFANTAGGRIILGLRESGGFTPAQAFAFDTVSDQFVEGIGRGGITGAKLTSPPTFEMSRCEFEGRPVLVIDVAENAPADKPCFVTARGIVNGSYRRIDDKDIKLTASELFELQNVFEPSAADREAVDQATVDDLDPVLLDRLVSARAASKALAGVTDPAHRLARLNVTDPAGRITLAALLTLGRYPQQFFPRLLIDVVVHPTVEGATPDGQLRFADRHECEGPLADMVAEAEAVVRRNLRTHSVMRGIERLEELEVPALALREAIANAVLHREYHPLFLGQPVSVDVYPDRIVITSPGGLWGGKTLDTLANGESRCRNGTLLKLLQHVPISEGQGRVAEGEGGGIQMMNQLMDQRALDRPDYRGTGPDAVRVVLRRHGLDVPALQEWLRETLPRPASTPEQTAVIIARREGHVDVSSLHSALGADSDDVRSILRTLHGEGILRSIGPEDYVLAEGSPTLDGAALSVLNVLSPVQPLSIHEISTATGRSVGALRQILRNLVAEGQVTATAPPTSRNRRYLAASTAQ